MTVSHSRLQRYTVTACFGALAFVLMLFEFPVIPVVSYYVWADNGNCYYGN